MKRSVQFVNSCALILLLVAGARADPTTCSPVFLANPQGRPLANTAVSVTHLDGSVIASGVWSNASGTQAFNSQMPAGQVLQVYIEAGTYKVVVSGEGIVKSFQVVCGEGFDSTAGIVSIDRTADLLLLSTSSPPILGCVDNLPCTLAYDPDNLQMAVFDFVMPTRFPLTFLGISLSWRSILAGPGVVVWGFNWCKYAVGEPPCDPMQASNSLLVPSTVMAAMDRVDVAVGASWVPAGSWPESEHVVIAVSRVGADVNDTSATPAAFENIQLEFAR